MYEQNLMGKRDNYYAASWFVKFTKFKRLQFGRYVLQVAGCRLQVEITCLFESKLNKPQYRG